MAAVGMEMCWSGVGLVKESLEEVRLVFRGVMAAVALSLWVA